MVNKQYVVCMLELEARLHIYKYDRLFSQLQGCQLPDFSLRSQTFCYITDFATTFFYMLETKTFLHIPSQNHQQAP